MYDPIYSFQEPYALSNIFMPIFQVKEWRLREVKWFAQGPIISRGTEVESQAPRFGYLSLYDKLPQMKLNDDDLL